MKYNELSEDQKKEIDRTIMFTRFLTMFMIVFGAIIFTNIEFTSLSTEPEKWYYLSTRCAGLFFMFAGAAVLTRNYIEELMIKGPMRTVIKYLDIET